MNKENILISIKKDFGKIRFTLESIQPISWLDRLSFIFSYPSIFLGKRKIQIKK